MFIGFENSITKEWKMLTAIKLAIKYQSTLPVAIKFINEIADSVGDGKITKSERSRIYSAMWEVIKEIQRIKKEGSLKH